MCYNNKSHNVYDEDIEDKEKKMLSLIIKKVWYIPLKKKNDNNSERKQIEIAKMSSYPKLSFWRSPGQQFGRVGK